MGIKLEIEATFKTICTIGRDEAKALLNIFDCMMDNENGYDDLERILEYRLDNLISNLSEVQEELVKYVDKKKEDIFKARIDARVDAEIDRIQHRRAWAIGE